MFTEIEKEAIEKIVNQAKTVTPEQRGQVCKNMQHQIDSGERTKYGQHWISCEVMREAMRLIEQIDAQDFLTNLPNSSAIEVRRVVWQNDTPASEKQIAFVENLVYRIKAQCPAAAAIHADDRMMWELWEYADVPQDLTKSEASTLIDLLRYCQWNSITFAMDLATALLKRIEGGAITLGTGKHLCMLAISDCQSILDNIAIDKIKAAQMIAEERKARKVIA